MDMVMEVVADMDDVLKEAIHHTPKGWCWLIAPHEINKQQLLKLMEQLPSSAQRYTTREKHNLSQTAILVLDTIGLLFIILY